MIRALATAASGMQAEETRMDVTANNIANASTVGFKKSRAEFQDLVYQIVQSPGAATGAGTTTPTGTQIGMGVRVSATQRMHTQGSMRQTGNSLDLAVEGDGFFQVNMPDGTIAYTRDGQFRLDEQGRVVTAQGFPLTSEITVPPDASTVFVAADGTVTAAADGDTTPMELGNIELATFANPAGLRALGKNLLAKTSASGTAITGRPGENDIGLLAQGSLEVSNVSVIEEMLDLITGQRTYETNAKVISTVDEMLGATVRMR
ncbi:MAG: flagellar basal-body rod protein FlgG [Pseudomonadota bacterium]